MLSPSPLECLHRARDLDENGSPMSTAALHDAFRGQLAGSTLGGSFPYSHHHHQHHHGHGDLLPQTSTPSGHCAGQGQQQGRGGRLPRALSAVEPRDRLDYWVAATGRRQGQGQGQGKGQGGGRGNMGRAQTSGTGSAHCGVAMVGRCASARHRLARESDAVARMDSGEEACVASFLPSAGLKHCSSAGLQQCSSALALQSMPCTPAKQGQAQAEAEGEGDAQPPSFSTAQGVPKRRQMGSVPLTHIQSPAAVHSRRSSGDGSSHSREGGSHCQAQRATGVPCETALRTMFVHSLSVSSDPENYTGATGTTSVGDATAQAPVFDPSNPGVGCIRTHGGCARQGAKGSLERTSHGYGSKYSRLGLASGGGNPGGLAAYKQSHLGLPSVGALQSAMLPAVEASDEGSHLPMAGGPDDGHLRTQSARLGGLRVLHLDPQAHRGASPLERYHSLQDEGVSVHNGQRFHHGRPNLSPPPPSAPATPEQGSVFHWAAKARIHAKTDLSRRSSV